MRAAHQPCGTHVGAQALHRLTYKPVGRRKPFQTCASDEFSTEPSCSGRQHTMEPASLALGRRQAMMGIAAVASLLHAPRADAIIITPPPGKRQAIPDVMKQALSEMHQMRKCNQQGALLEGSFRTTSAILASCRLSTSSG